MTRSRDMGAREALENALVSVDWNGNIAVFLKQGSSAQDIAKCNLRLAVWSRQFERVDRGNPAVAFVREMQNAGHQVAALGALALYKPAAGAVRTVFETALYYTYFRTHPCELATLVRDPGYFVSKPFILEYHRAHTQSFNDLQNRFGLVGRASAWYGRISAIIHGQMPGAWSVAKSLAETGPNMPVLSEVVEAFKEGEELVHQFFLCTVGRELWGGFSSDSKRILAAGLSGEMKATLGIDTA